MTPDELADTLRQSSIVAELLNVSLSAANERIEDLERELSGRPTEWAYAQVCRALEHWRQEARRLGQIAGEEPRQMARE